MTEAYSMMLSPVEDIVYQVETENGKTVYQQEVDGDGNPVYEIEYELKWETITDTNGKDHYILREKDANGDPKLVPVED
jgi:hypothetical protein